MTSPRVTVVISTFNRCDQLAVAVNACLSQTVDVDYEVLIVDNNSTDGTRDWVAARIAAGATRLRYVHESRQGLPYARNAGIAHARGDIIAFTDDDVYVARDWVSAIARAFADNPDVDLIGGKVLPRWPDRVPGWFSRWQWAPLALQDKGDAPLAIDASNAAPCLIGASFAFRRRAFARVGEFDAAYTRGQDREIQMRLWKAGGRGLYVPSMVAWVDVPAERLTREYFRSWYTRSGAYAARMRLLDDIDRDGRLVTSGARRGRMFFGAPGFIYRAILQHAVAWLQAAIGRDAPVAFYHENRVRYLMSYVRHRAAERRGGGAPARSAARAITGEVS